MWVNTTSPNPFMFLKYMPTISPCIKRGQAYNILIEHMINSKASSLRPSLLRYIKIFTNAFHYMKVISITTKSPAQLMTDSLCSYNFVCRSYVLKIKIQVPYIMDCFWQTICPVLQLSAEIM